jgi:tRNA-intron endonuclease
MIEIKYLKGSFYCESSKVGNLMDRGFGEKDTDKVYFMPYEVLFLKEKNTISVLKGKNELDFDSILKLSKIKLYEYLVYKKLRTIGYIIKSGLKYGFTFRVYEKGVKPGQEHAIWLLEPALEKDSIKVRDIFSKNRIAHTSKKKVMLGIVDMDESVSFIELAWKKI